MDRCGRLKNNLPCHAWRLFEGCRPKSVVIARERKRNFWQLTALVLLLQLVVLNAMAASGALHKRCHDHADDPGHECAVTLMLHGGYDQVTATITPVDVCVGPPQMPVDSVIAIDRVPSHLVGGVLAHAPPRGP